MRRFEEVVTTATAGVRDEPSRAHSDECNQTFGCYQVLLKEYEQMGYKKQRSKGLIKCRP